MCATYVHTCVLAPRLSYVKRKQNGRKHDSAVYNVFEDITSIQWISNNLAVATTMKMPIKPKPEVTVICVVACGKEKLDETLVMIKSALVYAKKPLKIIVITEYKLIPAFHEKLDEWKQIILETSNKTFDFVIRPVTYPNYIDENEWKSLFKPCASLRLFLPDILNDTDSILYVDTDTLFLTQPEKVWKVFRSMNRDQFAALVKECEDSNTCWYPRFAKHPYVLPVGINSGVMLMNLTRMRETRWTQYLEPILREFKNKITWGDQDIINIFFHFHPENLYIFDCRYNYRPDHCMYGPVCNRALKDGAIILHGSRGVFHNKKQPPFYAVYQAMSQYQLDTDPYERLLFQMKDFVTQESASKCSIVWKVFIIRPELNLDKSALTMNYYQEDND
ncbi:glucoside xylosyltransferase 1 isoform X2 [Phymastichus coffea]|uniref:glucoside xylosyltransferase 1 isoform X2 n=1 Tax=Phymastichus coffea TaxID=108790 RepID=UPI00273B86A6|nr:glucoside xylosyltransferase 1 isoform X2 [Phymastichus coffea]